MGSIRRFFYILAVLLIASCSNGYRQVQITGTFDAACGCYAYATLFVDGAKRTVDSCKIGSSGKFLLNFEIEGCEVVEVYVCTCADPISLVVNPGDRLSIVQDGAAYLVSGSHETAHLQHLQREFDGYNRKIDGLLAMLSDTTLGVDSIEVSFRVDSVMSCAKRVATDFISDNPYSLTSMMLLNMELDSGIRFLPYADNRYYYRFVDSCLRSVFSNSYAVAQFYNMVRKLEVRYRAGRSTASIGIGDFVPMLNFSLVDGERITIPNYWCRMVLLDFNADWDLNVKHEDYSDVFEAFGSRGLRIVQVVSSVDTAACRKQMLLDSIPWFGSVIENPNTDAIIKLLGVVEFPSNFLLDRRGRILAKNVYGSELASVLGQNMPAMVVRPRVDTTTRRKVDSSLMIKPLVSKRIVPTSVVDD